MSESLALMVLPDVKCFAASKVDEILPNLFLGNMDAAKDLELLKSHAITHVVSAAVSDLCGDLFPDQMKYLLIDIEDNRSANIGAHFPQFIDFIRTALTEGGVIFVHCRAGTSRSVSLVMAYLMSEKGMTVREALLHIMGQRAHDPDSPYTHPNQGFIRQLIDFEIQLRSKKGDESGDTGLYVPSLSLREYFDKFSKGSNFPHEHVVS